MGERFGRTEIALLAVVCGVWGSSYVFIRQGIVAGAAPLPFAAVRYALSAAVFGAIALAGRAPRPDRHAAAVSAAVGGLLIIGGYGGLLYWAEQYTTGGYAALLASTVPLLTVVIGRGVLSERLGRWGLVGIGIGFTGAALLVGPTVLGGAGGWAGPGFLLGAMTSMATGTVLLRRWGRGPQGLWQIAAQFAVAAALLAGAAAAVPAPRTLPLTPDVLGSLAFLVGLSSAVGYFAYFALHHRVGPMRANVVAYLSPIVGVALGTGVFAEPLTVWEVAGVAVVLVGVTLVLRDPARRPVAAPAERASGSRA